MFKMKYINIIVKSIFFIKLYIINTKVKFQVLKQDRNTINFTRKRSGISYVIS